MISTVIGGGGFIGRHLVAGLQRRNMDVFVPPRGDHSIFTRPLGQVFYCAGVTADFRSRPFDTIEAHVSLLSKVLQSTSFDGFTYLSSTRVYAGACSGCEDQPLRVYPRDPNDLYNISKLAGETLCLSTGQPNVRVVRVSNVVGFDPQSVDFLSSLIKEALRGIIQLQVHPDSGKDYIDIGDVVAMLTTIAERGERQIYNLASGTKISHRQIINELVRLTGCKVELNESGSRTEFPNISISLLKGEFSFEPQAPLDRLPSIVEKYRAVA